MSYGEGSTDVVGKRGKGQIMQDLVVRGRNQSTMLTLVGKHWKILNPQKTFDLLFKSLRLVGWLTCSGTRERKETVWEALAVTQMQYDHGLD